MVPTLFLNHGAPTLALMDSEYTQFLSKTGQRFTPRGIVVFSAHWEEPITTISYARGPLETIYDFGGFPPELYQVTYPAIGSPELAGMVEALLVDNGFATRRTQRGLDHGAWVILRHLYPKADIPVVTVSINPFGDPLEQYRIGQALKPLAADDVLIIGSGTTVHNFSEIRFHDNDPAPWAVEFDAWIEEHLRARNLSALFSYDTLGPHARRAVPRPEHFVPLFVAMGGSVSETPPQRIFTGYDWGSLSYACYEF